MIRTSGRAAGAVVVLSLVAALLVAVHGWRTPVSDPCLSPESLFAAKRFGTGRVTGRESGELASVGRLDGRIDRLPRGANELLFRVDRDVDVYPFMGLNRVNEFEDTHAHDGRRDIVAIDAGDVTLFVHWFEEQLTSKFRLRVHHYAQDRRPVEGVFGSTVGLALPQLVSGARPVTLFVLAGFGHADAAPAMRRAAEDWLRAAWADFVAACGTP